MNYVLIIVQSFRRSEPSVYRRSTAIRPSAMVIVRLRRLDVLRGVGAQHDEISAPAGRDDAEIRARAVPRRSTGSRDQDLDRIEPRSHHQCGLIEGVPPELPAPAEGVTYQHQAHTGGSGLPQNPSGSGWIASGIHSVGV